MLDRGKAVAQELKEGTVSWGTDYRPCYLFQARDHPETPVVVVVAAAVAASFGGATDSKVVVTENEPNEEWADFALAVVHERLGLVGDEIGPDWFVVGVSF